MTTDISKQLLDYSLHHQISLGRYSNSVVRDILALLNDADKEILAKILKRGEDGTFTKARLDALLKELRAMTKETYAQAHNEMQTAMLDFAGHEAAATAAVLATQVAVNFNIVQPTAEQLAAIASKTPITVGPDKKLLLEEIFDGLCAGKEENIRGAIRLGMVEGETVPEMVRRLQGSRASRYTDGIFEKDRRNAEAIVRTVVNHTSNQAAQLTFQANSAVVKGWQFLATLDNRTTIICASLSGTKWLIGQGPLPPRHVRCRSFQIPVLATWKELGFDMEEMPVSYRSSMNGPVRSDISMDSWMRTQSKDDIRDMLGPTRAKLFIDGNLKVDRFADRAGVVYDLKELKARNEAAFKKVFG
jgi:SPP1 gp7 family putative phage head morphogenesis protein